MKRGLLALILLAVALPATAASAQDAKPSKRCDFTDPAVCLYPWPNDLFTRSDDSATGRRLNLKRASMPRNKDGKPIDPRDINRADGFSPGSMLITKVPGLDTPAAARRSKLPPIGNLSRSLAKRSPVVVIDARTRKRHPIWAEVDSNPNRPLDPPEPRLPHLPRRPPLAQPPREPAAQALRAHVPHAPQGGRETREPLPRLGLHRGEPPEPGRTRAPHPRPRLQSARRHQPPRPRRAGQLAHFHRRHGPGPHRGRGRPDRAAHDPAAPPKARAALYGHGLLGDPAEFDASNVKSMSNEHNVLFCATAWAGFAEEDIVHIGGTLNDLSGFN